jgi:hypothetical protein
MLVLTFLWTFLIGTIGIKSFAFFAKFGDSGRAKAIVAAVTLLLVIGPWAWYMATHTGGDRVRDREQADREFAESECVSTTGAYAMSQGFVSRALKAPATAVFPSSAVSSTVTGKCEFVVAGFVDSQNSFGGNIRTSYVAKLKYLPASKDWQLLSLTM